MNDRIAQMALEAGLPRQVTAHPAFKQFVKAHAAMVAEDCAKLVDGNAAQCSGMTAKLMQSNADAIRARYK